jgi:hypothetical protein
MKTETILYTDGHNVTVTNTYFKVKNSLYQLKGITNHGFLIIRPERLPAMLIILLGIALMFFGFSQLIPENLGIKLFSIQMTTNEAATGFGLALFVVGFLALSFMRVRYAIRIATAEGEKNVIVSRKKEYVTLILDALNHAFINLVSPSREFKKPTFETK